MKLMDNVIIEIRRFLVVLILIIGQFCNAQAPLPSATYIQSCFNKRECFSISNSGFIFFNQNNSELIVQIDFNKFKIGNDSLDEWLLDLAESHLIFKGHLNSNNLLALTHHISKPIIINGILNLNGVSKPYTIELNIFEISKDGFLFLNNSQDYFDRVNVNFHLGFYPKEFNIHKKHHHYKKSISISIYRGYINELKPEYEFLIKETKTK